MQPEAEIAEPRPFDVDDPGDGDHRQTEDHRDVAARVPIRVPVARILAEDQQRQVHRQKPQRHAADEQDEGKGKETQRQRCGRDGRKLHIDPASVHQREEVAIFARLVGKRPEIERVLHAVDGERRHRHRDRNRQTAGRAGLVLAPQNTAKRDEAQRRRAAAIVASAQPPSALNAVVENRPIAAMTISAPA